jgi:hypothetical protein
MDNLPIDKNQSVDDNQKVTNDNPPVTPPETPPISTTETPPEQKPETTPPSPEEQPKSEEQPKEQPIEVGSLEQQPAFTSYTQGATDDDSKSKKGKKIKTIASVLGILLIIAALPLTVILVKQRQELRKEAAGAVEPSGSANVCGVVLSATHSYSNGRLTTTFSLKNTRSDTASFEFHTYSCVCSGGYQKPCGTNSGSCSSTNDRITLAPGGTTSKTVSAVQPGGDCGSFQNDGFIIAVNGNQNCSNNK